jgi:rhamnosyl/mannosyltransferase
VGKYYPPEVDGGLERVIVELNAALAARGVAAEVVVAAARGDSRVETVGGVTVHRRAPLATVLSQPVLPGLAGTIRSVAADVIHLHHPNPLGDLAVLRDARPLVVTHHSEIVRQRWLAPVYLPLVRRTLQRAAAVAVGSAQLLAISRELRGLDAKVRVIPFGIDARRFAATPAALERAAALRRQWGDRPVVLAVGRLVPYKGFDVLLQAATGLDATVVIVGDGPEGGRLRALAPPNGVLAGRVPAEDLVAAYHACDVFCLPSRTIAEAFGMVLLEAMACGKPLVTTALPTGVSAVNRDGRTGLVVPVEDAGALRDALRSLLADGSTRAAMGHEARALQAAEYGAELMAERYLSLYREAAGSAGGAGARQARREA